MEPVAPAVSVESPTVTELSTEEVKKDTTKRKRGRVAHVQNPAKSSPRKNDEEDVCFICFDGGNLVLCDRRFCPKAYHPACVHHDEEFFQKGRWNCGWHICSICEKAAHYMCYTCTYSLCKTCIRGGGFSCVRANKGLCQTCLRTVMLIEKHQAYEKESKPMVEVDFDDKSSWEYLFKEYWLHLKRKLLITEEELIGAKNPWDGAKASYLKRESSDELYDANKDIGDSSDSSAGIQDESNSKRKNVKKQSKSSHSEEDLTNLTETEEITVKIASNDTEWASKELLEFISHMRNGNESVLSQFDVQALLLEYIKQNNLRDPRKKSQVICDSRLESLFGKPRVGHFEMLKLLESHFLVKEVQQNLNGEIQRAMVDSEGMMIDVDINSTIGSGKKRRGRKKLDEPKAQPNIDDYAAIDVHNINLIYLKRNLMEDLLDDDKFQDKVVGSFVRIRISGVGQKQDKYRLVQVVGTRKVEEAYKTGRRTTDCLLEILNLNKTEVVSIDTISNQDFSEEECKRLRQSIKCGLISRLTVGEVQDKAMSLQTVRVNDWIEAEMLRLNHLRDRASEKGKTKELRECVEKLQVLGTAEERSRRLHELPDVHPDPNMDPDYNSDENEKKPDDNKTAGGGYRRPGVSGCIQKGRDPTSFMENLPSHDVWNVHNRNSTTKINNAKIPRKENSWDGGNCSGLGLKSEHFNAGEKRMRKMGSSGCDTVTSKSKPSMPMLGESEKLWHYQDPSGKIQGPFSIMQLHKWDTTGYFPSDLRVWRTSQNKKDSILLPDALAGKFKEVSQWGNNIENREKISYGNKNSPWICQNQNDDKMMTNQKGENYPLNRSNLVSTKNNGRETQSSTLIATGCGFHIYPPDGNMSHDTLTIEAWDSQPQIHNPRHNISSSAKLDQSGNNIGRWNSIQNRANKLVYHSTSQHAYENQISNNYQTVGENWKSHPDIGASQWERPSVVEISKFTGGWDYDQVGITGSSNLQSLAPNLPTPAPREGEDVSTRFITRLGNHTTNLQMPYSLKEAAGSAPVQPVSLSNISNLYQGDKINSLNLPSPTPQMGNTSIGRAVPFSKSNISIVSLQDASQMNNKQL